jgi:hypothetical protein
MVPDIVDVPVLVALNDGTFPEPLAPKPISVLEFVHANVPPVGVLTKFVAGTLLLLQTVMFAGTVTVGIGLIVIFAVALVAAQPPAAAILFVTV